MAQNLSLRLFYKVIHFLLIAELVFAHVQSECNVCSPASGLACVSGNQFQVCVGDIPTGKINTCPSGTVCSSHGSRICQKPEPNTIEACQDCNRCDVTNTFACTGPSTYALCLGQERPSDLVGSCKPNHVCNRNNEYICEDSRAGGVATCPSDMIPEKPSESTPAPAPDPKKFCSAKQQNGRFPVGSEMTEFTCKYYFYCRLRGGIWNGQLNKCAGKTYFNRTSRLCELSVPPGC